MRSNVSSTGWPGCSGCRDASVPGCHGSPRFSYGALASARIEARSFPSTPTYRERSVGRHVVDACDDVRVGRGAGKPDAGHRVAGDFHVLLERRAEERHARLPETGVVDTVVHRHARLSRDCGRGRRRERAVAKVEQRAPLVFQRPGASRISRPSPAVRCRCNTSPRVRASRHCRCRATSGRRIAAPRSRCRSRCPSAPWSSRNACRDRG